MAENIISLILFKAKSTEKTLLYFEEQVYDSLNNGKFCAGLFVNVMKAFDAVDHAIVLGRLSNAGIRVVAHRWFGALISFKINSLTNLLLYTEFLKAPF